MQRKKQGKGVAERVDGARQNDEAVPVSLSPSLLVRLERMAQQHGTSSERELHELVHRAWIKFATEHRLKEW